MATSQSLASIMEEMVTKVMEDAVSTSIIFTQAPVDESGKEKVLENIVVDISSILCVFCTGLVVCDRGRQLWELFLHFWRSSRPQPDKTAFVPCSSHHEYGAAGHHYY